MTTRLLFELSGEHVPLARAEVEGALRSLDLKITAGACRDASAGDDPLFIVDIEDGSHDGSGPERYGRLKALADSLASRLGYCHSVDIPVGPAWDGDDSLTDEFLAEVAEDFVSLVHEIAGPSDRGPAGGPTFSVRGRRFGERREGLPVTENSKRLAGAILSRRGAPEVDLSGPEFPLRLLAGVKVHAGIELARVDRGAQEDRGPLKRPYFHPTSLHPRLAMAMVNLSGVSSGGTVYDPFCGTGGIVIESSLMGYRTYGSDLEPEKVDGTGKNLDHLGIRGPEIFQGDFRTASVGLGITPDAWVTEPPYGRSSSHSFGSLPELYSEMLAAASRHLGADGIMVCTFPGGDSIPEGTGDMSLVLRFDIRVHSSLERTVCVYTK